MKNYLKFTTLVLLALQVACVSKPSHVNGTSCLSFRDSFILQPLEIKEKIFNSLTFEEKYVRLICASQYFHPSDKSVPDFFSREGSRALPFLKEKLQIATGDLTVRDIVYVFQLMQRHGEYDIIHDQETISLINTKIAKMKDKGWKEVVEKQVNSLLEEFGDKPFKNRT